MIEFLAGPWTAALEEWTVVTGLSAVCQILAAYVIYLLVGMLFWAIKDQSNRQ